VSTDSDEDSEVVTEVPVSNQWDQDAATPNIVNAEHLDDRESRTDAVVSAGPTGAWAVVGWEPDPLPPPEPRRAPEVTAGMTDEQILAHYRVSRGNPFMTAGTARALYHLDLKYRHHALAAVKVKQEAIEEQRRHLRALVNAKAANHTTRESSADSGP
jgi:hypothetical protein